MEQQILRTEYHTITTAYFVIPKGVTLLSSQDNKSAKENTPWSWWTRWGELHYIDDEGHEHRISPRETIEPDMKFPDLEEFEEEDEMGLLEDEE